MKKRIWAIILSAVLLLSVSACDNTSNNNIPKEESESTATTENTSAGNKDVFEPTQIVAEGSISCNGNDNTRMAYDINQDSKVTLHIKEWSEERLLEAVSSFSSDAEIESFRRIEKAIAINNELACLFLQQQGKITVVKFEKGSPNETVTSLDVSEGVIGLYGNFINENVGYLFVYKEVSDYYARGGAKLSSLFITEDGGNTRNLNDVHSAPSISLQENIVFSKMISEDVGLISGNFFGADYDFCDRTLLTTDGGRTWVNVANLPQINKLQWAIVTDFTQTDGAYVLTIRYTNSETTAEYGYAEYKLTDLNTWIRVD